MKKQVLILAGILLTGLFILNVHTAAFSQSKKSDIRLMFQRQANGKVIEAGAADQKIFNFLVDGPTTQVDIDNFTSQIKGKAHVYSVNITQALNDGQRKGSVVMDPMAKASDYIVLLQNAGISSIYIDGELKSVEDLAKDKNASDTK